MITKLTAENAELYYAPRFAQITAAFKAIGSPIEIHSLEDYFGNLLAILALEVGEANAKIPSAYLLVAPADEDIFEINANTRAITVPNFVKKNGIGVYGDHYAEMIIMTIDRYFDHEDFNNDKIAINWNFTARGSKTPYYEENQAADAFAANAELNPGYVTFGFIITKDMTPCEGTLTFSVTIYDKTEGGVNSYSFNTLPVSVDIKDTLTLKDPSIVKDNGPSYVGRLVNSVYNNNTVSPVGDPVWKSGYEIGNGVYSGLNSLAYFSSDEDLTNTYTQGVLLKAYAVTEPNTADIVYKWSFAPEDGTVKTLREFEVYNQFSDYIEVPQLVDNGVYYYKKNALGNIDTQNPLTYAEAQALVSSEEQYLPLKVKKLDVVANDENHDVSLENQNNLILSGTGNIIRSYSKLELNSFASTNPSQGEGKWIGFDIDTGLESIIGVNWNNYPLTADDVAEAASIGLGAGHIVFWAKAEALGAETRSISLSADGYKPTPVLFSYNGIETNIAGSDDYISVINDMDAIKFVIRGSSCRALSAGNYQVTAQAMIGAGTAYEKVLSGAELVVDKEYFVKVNGEIDALNPLTNQAAKDARQNGQELYVLASVSRSSNPVNSEVLRIPPAVKPEVTLNVGSEFVFGEDVAIDPDYVGDVKYTYIDSVLATDIVAHIDINSDNIPLDSAGAFAAELVKADSEELTLSKIKEKIANSELVFTALPENNDFIFELGEVEEGEYVVRAINRRNGTYSVSDNSSSIVTSFVAPAINNITVQALMDDDSVVDALVDGAQPNGDLLTFLIEGNKTKYDFLLIDNSDNFADAVVTYYIEEVKYNTETGEVSARTPDAEGNNPETGKPYEYFGEDDLREIEPVQSDNENVYKFSIDNDPGFYRIKTINRYHGTMHTAYTDVFGIASY